MLGEFSSERMCTNIFIGFYWFYFSICVVLLLLLFAFSWLPRRIHSIVYIQNRIISFSLSFSGISFIESDKMIGIFHFSPHSFFFYFFLWIVYSFSSSRSSSNTWNQSKQVHSKTVLLVAALLERHKMLSTIDELMGIKKKNERSQI